jgi:hypothetical protein
MSSNILVTEQGFVTVVVSVRPKTQDSLERNSGQQRKPSAGITCTEIRKKDIAIECLHVSQNKEKKGNFILFLKSISVGSFIGS